MTFRELKLLAAIHAANFGCAELITQDERLRLYRTVIDFYICCLNYPPPFTFSVDEVYGTHVNHRKSTTTRMKAEIALAHGYDCFWKNRGKGPCCDDVEAGHLIPRKNGGELTVANGIIECRSHNNQRREMQIEEYLASDLST